MGICPTEVAHGWNIAEWVSDPFSSVLRPACRSCGTSRVATTSDTLLGPEGSGPVEHLRTTVMWSWGACQCLTFGPSSLVSPSRVAVSSRRPGHVRPCMTVLRHGTRGIAQVHRPYLENCTVDASIQTIFFVVNVVKLLRAHGGCLGIRSR